MGKEIEKKISARTETLLREKKITQQKVTNYYRLLEGIEKKILPHPAITKNEFTGWFGQGLFDDVDLKNFLVQWSVFSNLFLEAQLKKTLNAPNIEAMRASKEILLNELGVVFKPDKISSHQASVVDGADPNLVSTEGSVEGGVFRFAAAHFEWLLKMCRHVGLEYPEVGKRRNGSVSTVFYCDELSRLYGSDDPHIALGASFGVENWAAAGMWKEQIRGLEIYKKRDCPDLPLAFFYWHDRIEDQHAQHTWDELEEEYFSMDLNEDKFFQGANEMLNGVKAFWDGLNQDRLKREKQRKNPNPA